MAARSQSRRPPGGPITGARTLLLTAEHAGHRVPGRYRSLFAHAHDQLLSHRGWDPGTLALARDLARQLNSPLLATTVTRLLVEVNRSPGHPQLFSEFTGRLDPAARHQLLERYYWPHRRRVIRWLAAARDSGLQTLHLAVHSFTPVLNGVHREADLGLLYDPRRAEESQLCRRWAELIRANSPRLRVRMNYPYLGRSDGLTTALRRQFPTPHYLGIELEVNQQLVRGGRRWASTKQLLGETLQHAWFEPPTA